MSPRIRHTFPSFLNPISVCYMSYQYKGIDTQDIQSLLGNSGSSSIDQISESQQSLPEFVRSFANEEEDLVLSRDALSDMFNALEKNELIELLAVAVTAAPEARSLVGYSLSNMSTFRRLLVRNIAFTSTSDEVKELLSSRYGMIEEGSVVYDRTTGKSKGFAFMTFATVDSACTAIVDSNNGLIELSGRQLLLKFAADRVDAINAKPVAPETPEISSTAGRRLYISGLASETSSDRLAEALARFGAMEECFVVSDSHGVSRKFGFATFTSEESAWHCMQRLPVTPIDGQLVSVQIASENTNKSAPITRRASKLPITRQNSHSTTTSTPLKSRASMQDDLLSTLLSGIVPEEPANNTIEDLWGSTPSEHQMERLAQQFLYLSP